MTTDRPADSGEGLGDKVRRFLGSDDDPADGRRAEHGDGTAPTGPDDRRGPDGSPPQAPPPGGHGDMPPQQQRPPGPPPGPGGTVGPAGPGGPGPGGPGELRDPVRPVDPRGPGDGGDPYPRDPHRDPQHSAPQHRDPQHRDPQPGLPDPHRPMPEPGDRGGPPGGPPPASDGSTTDLRAGGGNLPDPERAGLLRDSDALRSQWQQVQGMFVDDPQRAVHEAGALVDRTLDEMKSTLGVAAGDGSSTEDLRVAFQRYRDFFHRLLSA